MNESSFSNSFSSFNELKSAVEDLEQSTGVTYYIRYSKTLNAAAKKCPRSEKANKNLKYYELKYNCYKGGLPPKQSGEKQRNTRTTKEGCQAHIRVRLSEDATCLEVKSIALDHNHDIDKNSAAYLSKNRRLEGDAELEVSRMLQFKCNKKLVKDYVQKKFGKVITLKDLTNLRAKAKLTSNHCESELEEAVKIIKRNDPSALLEILVDESDTSLQGIFYQSQIMQKFYAAYPEVLLCDSTYKLNNLKMPLYVLMVVDGNGHGHIIGTFILSSENIITISHMISLFQKHNSWWNETKTIITDKDFKEKRVFQDKFPNARTVLCLFHVLKTFRSQITTEKMCIKSIEREACLDVLQSMTYAKTEEKYFELYEKLKSFKFPKVLAYFNANWHEIRDEWVQGLKRCNNLFGIWTTNHLESCNALIKQVVSRFSPLPEFFNDLLIVCRTKQEEHNKIVNDIKIKTATIQYPENSPEYMYEHFLTPHAFTFVEKQIQYSKNIEILDCSGSGSTFRVKTHTQKIVEVSKEKCQCSFWTDMHLPCSHILSVLNYLGESLFQEHLIHRRYKKSYYIESQIMNSGMSGVNENSPVVEVLPSSGNDSQTEKVLTCHEKYRKCIDLFQKVATDVADFGTKQFLETMEQLKNLSHLIHDRKSFLIVEEECANPSTGSNVTCEDADNEMSYTIDPLESDEFEPQIEILTPYFPSEERSDSSNYFISVPSSSGNGRISSLIAAEDSNEVFLQRSENIVLSNTGDRYFLETGNAEFENTSLSPHQKFEAAYDSCISLSDIKTDCHKVKQIGRPKGHGMTTIGLKRKRVKRKSKGSYKKPRI